MLGPQNGTAPIQKEPYQGTPNLENYPYTVSCTHSLAKKEKGRQKLLLQAIRGACDLPHRAIWGLQKVKNPK